jgi:poly-beta-1,6-N-acetyl-D-glucosamine synthase
MSTAAAAWIAGALAALVYTYFGYPVLIGVLARLRPAAAAAARVRARGAGGEADDPGALPSVSVVLPVRDAALALPAKIASIVAQDYPAEKIEILVYCDGCSDGSAAVARELAAGPALRGRMHVLESTEGRGKPTGINTLAAAARGDLLLLNDVRQRLSPNTVRDMTDALADPTVGFATGRLVLEGGAGSGAYWRYEDWIRRQESRFRGVVGMTGAVAMMRRQDFTPLPADLILDDVWMPMTLVMRGKRVRSVPEALAFDQAFEDDREFRRKVRTLAGNYQLFRLMPRLLVPFVNPIWWETFSHKVMRLIAPWLMLALLGASAACAASSTGGARAVALALTAAQAAFYLAAAVGPRGGRAASLARTFVVLNAAAVVGLLRYLTGRVRW